MRLWSLHPKYLDSRGLVAVWREGLLAQAVLKGKTRGYRTHPQLVRFLERPSPVGFIADYLRAVFTESQTRGYRFDRDRIDPGRDPGMATVTEGQLMYEWRHLVDKVSHRDRAWAARLGHIVSPCSHPLFQVVPGAIEEWERVPGIDREQGGP